MVKLMGSSNIIIPIAIAITCIFVFYASGVIILELIKFKTKNPYAAIAAGFFSYFTFISIFTFPLQLISVLPYIFFIYYLWALSIVYIIFCLVFAKHWLSLNLLSKNLWFFILAVIVIGVATYFEYKKLGIENEFSRHKNILSILSWLRDNPVSFFNNSTLFNFLGFRPFQGWYTFQLSMIILTGVQSYQYQDIIMPLSFILDVFLCASIFITMFDSFDKTSTAYKKYALYILSLFLFTLTKIAFIHYDYAYWTGDTIFLYLIFYAMVLALRYTNIGFRERKMPLFIGLVIGGYISFSWNSSYQVLFLIYCILFIIQKKYNTNFTKDFLKISSIAVIDLIFFNLVSKYYIPTILFAAILLLIIVTTYFMSKKYSAVVRFETFVDSKITLVTLLLPIVFMIVSIAMTLKTNRSFVDPKESYLNFLYVWTNLLPSNTLRFWATFIAAMSILILSVVWVFLRKKFKLSLITGIVDLTLINYLTFYNPIAVKFINLIYPMMSQSNGLIMIVQGSVLMNILVYWFFNKQEEKNTKNKSVVVIKNFNWLKL
ncbi:hypothetical protein [Spiroplasma tabanidicola]|uniref:Uncharacterized protein n=1 Tax=Spiroplasma tabanidicola TaxID=324079 RepID=A0A6I6CBK1_9MOLU|nr:hypothetical protein [Spiroplasma tabanidicola]QGS51568.1 hypothetical protein STABA_v1c02010 [Spiroplasma tabanidicola]